MIGRTISHYTITTLLGEGGMGEVYKANDTNLKRDVAIKFLPPRVAAANEDRQRFRIEAQAAAALNHPNIATIHAIEEVDDQTFIVMEFVDGEELKSKIAAGPLSLETLFDVAEQIAEGLHEAHEKGIVHRDIKPSNIMLTAKDRVKIMDFGLAKTANRTKLTQTGTTIGTVAYMSPEQAILYQNAFFESLTMTRKTSLGLSVAENFLNHYGEQSIEIAAELAFLFESGRDFEHASDYFLQAARNAARLYASEEAVELSQRSIVNAEKLTGKARHQRILDATLNMAQLHLTLSRFEDTAADFGLAERAAREIQNTEAEINALCGAAFALFNLKDLSEMLKLGNRALELARTSNSSVGVASAELVLGHERMCSGALSQAEDYYDRSIQVLKDKDFIHIQDNSVFITG